MFDFLISLAPIAVMLVTLLIMKMPAKKASASTFTVAMIEFILI